MYPLFQSEWHACNLATGVSKAVGALTPINITFYLNYSQESAAAPLLTNRGNDDTVLYKPHKGFTLFFSIPVSSNCEAKPYSTCILKALTVWPFTMFQLIYPFLNIPCYFLRLNRTLFYSLFVGFVWSSSHENCMLVQTGSYPPCSTHLAYGKYN